MAKDPAVLWYWNDWHGGTVTMSRHLKGCYVDLLHAQFNNGRLSLEEVEVVLGADYPKAWITLKKKFKVDDEGLFYNQRHEEEKEKRKAYTESRRHSRSKADEDKVRIYLLKDNTTSYVKIGSSVNPIRRYNEITNQKDSCLGADGIRDYGLLWYSGLVERKIEKSLHTKYKELRIKGEWFKLSAKEIGEIKRTLPRTENEDVNININDNINNIKERDVPHDLMIKTYGVAPTHPRRDLIEKWLERWGDKKVRQILTEAYHSNFHNFKKLDDALDDKGNIKPKENNGTFKRQPAKGSTSIDEIRDGINKAYQ